jgi:hypothetical protein
VKATRIICVGAGLLLMLSLRAVPSPVFESRTGAAPVIQEAPAATPEGGEVHPPALPPRQRVGVIVFLAWMWALVGVLLYFLRLKVREADRVFRTGFYDAHDAEGEEPRSP